MACHFTDVMQATVSLSDCKSDLLTEQRWFDSTHIHHFIPSYSSGEETRLSTGEGGFESLRWGQVCSCSPMAEAAALRAAQCGFDALQEHQFAPIAQLVEAAASNPAQ